MKTKKRPRRAKKTLKHKLNRTIRLLRERVNELLAEVSSLTRQLDTTTRQMRETVRVNGFNATVHRATEVAMLHQNHELQRAKSMLAGRPVHPELGGVIPALAVPKPIPLTLADLEKLSDSTTKTKGHHHE